MVLKMAFKLTNMFFFIRLDRSRLTNLSRSRSIRFVHSEHNLCIYGCNIFIHNLHHYRSLRCETL